MDCNHAQNQGHKISVNPVEGLSIQPVEWWSPWESQLINKGALCLMHPHQWMTAHSHESQTNEGFGKKWENYIEIRYKNFIPLIQRCIIAWYNFQIDFILQKYYMVNQEFVIFFSRLNFYEIGDSHNFGEISHSTKYAILDFKTLWSRTPLTFLLPPG